jgi:hypothetical protein
MLAALLQLQVMIIDGAPLHAETRILTVFSLALTDLLRSKTAGTWQERAQAECLQPYDLLACMRDANN